MRKIDKYERQIAEKLALARGNRKGISPFLRLNIPLYIQRGDLKNAKRDLLDERADIDLDNPFCYFIQAMAYRREGRTNEAKLFYSLAAEYDSVYKKEILNLMDMLD